MFELPATKDASTVFRAMADADPQVTLYESGDQLRVHIDLRDGPTPPK